MASIALKTRDGKDAGSLELDADVFGVQPNVPVMHQVVTAQLAARRAGTQSTKTRAEVAGGGRKPHRQKGTGGARQGSITAPHYSGGGVALGPKPRKYDQKTPKKMVNLALRSALSDRAAEGKVVGVDAWSFDTPSTKAAAAALKAVGAEGKVLVVVGRDEQNVALSFRNLSNVQIISTNELNAYDVLCNDVIVFSKATLPGSADGDAAAAKPAKKAPAAKKPVAADAPAPVAALADVPAVAEESASNETAAHDEPATSADDEPATSAATHAAGEWAGSLKASEDGSEPEGHAIKGNAQSMLYHVPGSRFYKQTKAEYWFDTEESAEAAGFSKPGSQKTDDEGAES